MEKVHATATNIETHVVAHFPSLLISDRFKFDFPTRMFIFFPVTVKGKDHACLPQLPITGAQIHFILFTSS